MSIATPSSPARPQHVIVVGAGAFGCAGALALRQRGLTVTLLDAGSVPHPAAASTDLSKMVRADYGSDRLYTALALAAIACWDRIRDDAGELLWRPDGFLVLSSHPPRPGDFVRESARTLVAHGLPLEPVEPDMLRRRFPAWNAARYRHGYYNPVGGWVPSARAIALWAARAQAAGVELRTDAPLCSWVVESGRVRGVRTPSGELSADHTVLAAGAWSPQLLAVLARQLDSQALHAPLRPVAQPLFHLRPDDPTCFRPPHFVPWAADIERTGWYGFPATEDGIVKIGNHGPGRPCEPASNPALEPSWIARLRAFLRHSIPTLAEAPVVETRWCWYCDSADGDFWIDRVPGLHGLTLATGGSGHAFKMLPVLGERIATRVLDEPDPLAHRFRWRPDRPNRASEPARCRDES